MRLAHWCFGAIVKKFGKVSGFLIENKKNSLKLKYMRKKMKKYPEIIGNVGVKKKKKCI